MADLLTDLERCLTQIMADDSFVVAVYVFGSCVRESAMEKSDLDLAFLLDHKAYDSNPLRATAPAFMIAARVGMTFDRKTDVTILNGSSVEMSYEVVTSGKCIYEDDLDTRLDYEAKVRGMYFDFRPFLLEMRARCLTSL